MRTETQDTSNNSMKKTFSEVYMMTEGDRLVSKNENRESNYFDAELKIDSLVHQACDERSRLLKAMQCSGDIFNSSVHCASHVLSLRRSQIVEKGNYEREIGVLKNRISGLLSIVESQQISIIAQTQALTLKGFWLSMLTPHSVTVTGLQDKKFEISVLDAEEDSAMALTLLSIQCASVVQQGKQKVQNREVNHTVINHTVRRCKLPRSPSGVNELDDEVDERRARMTFETMNEIKDNDIMYVLLDRVCSLRVEQMKKISTLEEENTVLRNSLQLRSVEIHNLREDRIAQHKEYLKHLHEKDYKIDIMRQSEMKYSEPQGMAHEDVLVKHMILYDKLSVSEAENVNLKTEIGFYRKSAMENSETIGRVKHQSSLSSDLNIRWKEHCDKILQENETLRKEIEVMKNDKAYLEICMKKERKKNAILTCAATQSDALDQQQQQQQHQQVELEQQVPTLDSFSTPPHRHRHHRLNTVPTPTPTLIPKPILTHSPSPLHSRSTTLKPTARNSLDPSDSVIRRNLGSRVSFNPSTVSSEESGKCMTGSKEYRVMHGQGDRFCDQIDFVMNPVIHSKSGNIRAYPASSSSSAAAAAAASSSSSAAATAVSSSAATAAAAAAVSVVVSPYINGTGPSSSSVLNRHHVRLPGEASISHAHVTPSSHSRISTPSSSSSSSTSSSSSRSRSPSPIHFIRSPDSHSSNLMRCRIDINGDDKKVENVGRLRDTNDDEERKKEKEREGKGKRERERDYFRSRKNTLVMDLKRDENVHITSSQKTHRKDYNGHTGHGNRSKSSERLSCSSGGYSFSSNSHMFSDDVIKCRDITSDFEPCKGRLKKEYDGDAQAPPHNTRTDKQQITDQRGLKRVVIISPDSPGIVTNEIRKNDTAYGPSGLGLKPEYMVDRFTRPIVTPLTVRKNTITL